MDYRQNIDKSVTKTKIIASGGPLQIELVDYVGSDDNDVLINISESLAEIYGPAARLTDNTIKTYFNRDGSIPFISRLRGEIIGYMIGVPLETLDREPWARVDTNFNKFNTIYTYAFVMHSEHQGKGHAKILKRVYLNHLKKQQSIVYVTGHVRKGIASRFTGKISIIEKIENWQGTGEVFEYYRRELDLH